MVRPADKGVFEAGDKENSVEDASDLLEMVTLPMMEQCENDGKRVRVESVQSSSSERDACATKATEIRQRQQEQQRKPTEKQRKKQEQQTQTLAGVSKRREGGQQEGEKVVEDVLD